MRHKTLQIILGALLGFFLTFSSGCYPPGKPVEFKGNVTLSLREGWPNGAQLLIRSQNGSDPADIISILLQQGENTRLIGAASFALFGSQAFIQTNPILPSALKDFHSGEATITYLTYDPGLEELIDISYKTIQLVD